MMRRQTSFCLLLLLSTALGFFYMWSMGNYMVGWRYSYGSESRSYVAKIQYSDDRHMVNVESDDNRILHSLDVRRRHVMDLCSRGLYQENTSLGHIIVVDEHKLLYCSVPKTGCTNWKRLFLVMSGRYNSTNDIEQSQAHQQFKTLADVTKTEAWEILETYTKVMILREPFGRIVSAFRNKFEDNSKRAMEFRKPFVSRIIKKYRGDHPVNASLIKGHNSVTFREFVKYLSDDKNTLWSPPEEHWRETYRLCSPCEVDYDYIGHFDTLSEDSKAILKVLNVTMKFPASTNPTNSSLKTVLQDYYNQINSTEMERLKSRYRVDILLFDSM